MRSLNDKDFWESIQAIIAAGFTPEGLQRLGHYAELFINGRLVYQRFSPFEQHGCATGGATHVIASLLAGADDSANLINIIELRCGGWRELSTKVKLL